MTANESIIEIKKTLKALPIYAADYQDSEMLLLPGLLRNEETLQAAVSACYKQTRGLLILTDVRILVICACATPIVLLDLPVEKIDRLFASAWYGSGNVNCYAQDAEYYFSLMSTAVYVQLAQRIECLAAQKRQRKEQP